MKSKGVVVIVDDDARIFQSLASLLESVGCRAAVFASAETVLESGLPAETRCAVLDDGLLWMSGSALRQILTRKNPDWPVILIAGGEELQNFSSADKADQPHFFETFDGGQLITAIRLLSAHSGNRRPRIKSDC